jgi:pimeloyl-ACP methyl ester carboxylesterase
MVDGLRRTVRAAFSRTCAYDRADLGRSGPDPGPRTIADLGDDLLTLLDVAGVEGPYVFVGGSYGGNIVTVLAARHPDAVAGLVLVDSQPAHVIEDNPFRLNLADADWEACCAGFELPAWDAADNREHIDFTGGLDEELATVDNQPQVPAIVLTATEIECHEAWPCEAILADEVALQARRWIEGNPLGQQILLESGHVVQRELPDEIVNHTRTVVEQVRSG